MLFRKTRFTVENIKSNKFFQMPQFLYEGEFKKKLTSDAKCLYTLLKDRHSLSLMNGWIDKNNEVYLIYTRENMSEMLGISKNTTKKVVEQLKEFGLIEETQEGFNRPNKIYLITLTPQEPALNKESQILTPGHANIGTPESQILTPNQTEYNKTNINNTNLSIVTSSKLEKEIKIKNNDGLIDHSYDNSYLSEQEKIKDNISYDNLIEKVDPKFVNNIMDIMVDNICTTKEYTTINDIDKPQWMIKDRLLEVRAEHIEKIYHNLKAKGREIQSPMSYYLSCLINSINQPTTVNNIYLEQNQEPQRKPSYDIDEYEKFSIFD